MADKEIPKQKERVKETQKQKHLAQVSPKEVAKAINTTKLPAKNKNKEKWENLAYKELINKFFQNQMLGDFKSGKMKEYQKTLLSQKWGDYVTQFKLMVTNGDLVMILKKIEEASKKYAIKIPFDIVFVALQESKWKPQPANSVTAAWYRQFTDASAKLYWITSADRFNKRVSTEAALRHFVENYKTVNMMINKLEKKNKKKLEISDSTKRMRAINLYNGRGIVKKQFFSTKGNFAKYNSKSSESNKYIPNILAVRESIQNAFNRWEFKDISALFAANRENSKYWKGDANKTSTTQEVSNITKQNKSQPIDMAENQQNINSPSFQYQWESKDGKYKVYSYHIQYGAKPIAVISQFLKIFPEAKQHKDTLLITDATGKEYPDNTRFKAKEKVFIKLPKAISI